MHLSLIAYNTSMYLSLIAYNTSMYLSLIACNTSMYLSLIAYNTSMYLSLIAYNTSTYLSLMLCNGYKAAPDCIEASVDKRAPQVQMFLPRPIQQHLYKCLAAPLFPAVPRISGYLFRLPWQAPGHHATQEDSFS
jgi:hypothetical protein